MKALFVRHRIIFLQDQSDAQAKHFDSIQHPQQAGLPWQVLRALYAGWHAPLLLHPVLKVACPALAAQQLLFDCCDSSLILFSWATTPLHKGVKVHFGLGRGLHHW
jgi:hypothetical protein